MPYTIKGATQTWEVVCGLEVHAQVTAKSKLFSGASAAYGGAPNDHVALVDVAFPGMLPVVNERCIEQAVKTGFGLNAQINPFSVFERKNYFYPDLPQGYQISQFAQPIVGEGALDVELEDGSTKTVRITRLHLEQDAGKSIHDGLESETLIDLNRSGCALMEIVTEPDIRSPEEAYHFIKDLRAILRALGTCDGNMEEGSLRCDANVSVRPIGTAELTTRCEVKNLNSMRFVAKAIEVEAKRQIELIESGGTVIQQTRLFNTATNETRAMRGKEESHDYRYFPDPDLLPITLTEDYLATIKSALPELPSAKKQRFMERYSLSSYDAGVLVEDTTTASFFETIANAVDAKLAANWVMNDLMAMLARTENTIDHSPVSSEQLIDLLKLIESKKITGRTAKDVFQMVVDEGGMPSAIVEAKGLAQMSDTGAIEAIVKTVIDANPDKVEQARENPKLLGWFTGQIMKQTGGKANPQLVQELLKKAIEG